MKTKFEQGDIVIFVRDGAHDCRYANYGDTPSSRPRAGDVGMILSANVQCVSSNATFANIAYLDEAFEETEGCHPIYVIYTKQLRDFVDEASETERAAWESRKFTCPNGQLKFR